MLLLTSETEEGIGQLSACQSSRLEPAAGSALADGVGQVNRFIRRPGVLPSRRLDPTRTYYHEPESQQPQLSDDQHRPKAVEVCRLVPMPMEGNSKERRTAVSEASSIAGSRSQPALADAAQQLAGHRRPVPRAAARQRARQASPWPRRCLAGISG